MKSMKISTQSKHLGNLYTQRVRHFTKPLFLTILITFIIVFALSACGPRTKVGTVTRFGQSIPAGGGLVQSFITVKLDDGNEVTAWLPNDDAIWTRMRAGAKSGNIRVEIKRDGEFWKFVQVLPKD